MTFNTTSIPSNSTTDATGPDAGTGPKAPKRTVIKRGDRFPAGARRACLILGRDIEVVTHRCRAGEWGFDVIDGRAQHGVDTAAGACLILR